MLREIKCLRKIRKDYFEPLVQTIDAGFASIAEDEKNQPHAADAFHVRKMSLQMLKDQLLKASEMVDGTLKEYGAPLQEEKKEEPKKEKEVKIKGVDKNTCAVVKSDKVVTKAPVKLHTKLKLFGDSKDPTNFEWKADIENI